MSGFSADYISFNEFQCSLIGEIMPWWREGSNKRLNGRQKFAELQSNGAVKINQDGLYYVYSQVSSYFIHTSF